MIFIDFIKLIPKIAKEKLLGEEAHKKMSPPERLTFLSTNDVNNFSPKRAAVLMLFYPKDALAHMVLIIRNEYPGVHSAQISFPGGKFEPFDKNMEVTALRETYEEIGVPPEQIKLVKAFSELYIPPSNFLVVPYLGYSHEELMFKLDAREVSSIIELSLSEFLNENNFTTQKMQTSYMKEIEIPVFKFGDNIVWGATAMMLSELKEVLKMVL